jgi:hypothetical protein
MGPQRFVDCLGVDACWLEDLLRVKVLIFIKSKLLFYRSNGRIHSLHIFLDFGSQFMVIDFSKGFGQIMQGLSQPNKC